MPSDARLERETFLPVHVRRLRLHAPLTGPLWAHVRCVRVEARAFEADFVVASAAGEILHEVEGCRAQAVAARVRRSRGGLADWLHLESWTPRPWPATPTAAPDLAPIADLACAARQALTMIEPACGPGFGAAVATHEANWTLAALRALGWRPVPGRAVDPDRLARRLGIVPGQSARFVALLDGLAAQGWLERGPDGGLRAARGLPRRDPLVGWRRLVAAAPALLPELTALRRTGERLAVQLSGCVGAEGPAPSESLTLDAQLRGSGRSRLRALLAPGGLLLLAEAPDLAGRGAALAGTEMLDLSEPGLPGGFGLLLARAPLMPALAQAAPEPVAAEGGPAWLLLGTGGDLGEALVGALRRRGRRVVQARRSDGYVCDDPGAPRLCPEDPGQVARLLAELAARGMAPGVVVFLLPLEAPPADALDPAALADGRAAGAVGLLHVIQTLESAEGPPVRLTVLTRGARATRSPSEPPVNPAVAPVWGLARVAVAECRGCAVQLIDLDPAGGDPETEAAAVLAELDAPLFEAEIALRVGPGVAGLAPGMRVLALGAGCLASHVALPARLVFPLPETQGFEAGATLPVAFLTAWHALHEVGRIRRGEVVLIHAATGGVGLAAIQVARAAGARVLATAGSPEKHDHLRALGVEAVMNSRALDFPDEVRRLTGGRGADLVLNALAGGAIAATLEVLAPGGRFLEIGKRDIFQNVRIGLRPFRHGLTLTAIDLHRVMTERPDVAARSLRAVLRGVGSGRCQPLPHRVFPRERALAAFRLMAQARHLGKIVLGPPSAPVAARPTVVPPPAAMRPDATYLITGGLGGFGLVLADELVAAGARHLVLVGRSGAARPGARAALARWRELGILVRFEAADVADPAALAGVLVRATQGPDALPPIRGVFHAAAVLDDGALTHLTAARLERVMAPKVAGAWALHRLTQGMALEHFVLFSSVPSCWGPRGRATMSRPMPFWSRWPNTAGRWGCRGWRWIGARSPMPGSKRWCRAPGPIRNSPRPRVCAGVWPGPRPRRVAR